MFSEKCFQLTFFLIQSFIDVILRNFIKFEPFTLQWFNKDTCNRSALLFPFPIWSLKEWYLVSMYLLLLCVKLNFWPS